jgi:hypothetical protein
MSFPNLYLICLLALMAASAMEVYITAITIILTVAHDSTLENLSLRNESTSDISLAMASQSLSPILVFGYPGLLNVKPHGQLTVAFK